MPPADSPLVPDPPPPRPDRREAAIEVALRRFDGAEEAAPAAERPRPQPGRWLGRPQLAMAMSIALIAVIGVPATWMAIRNGALTGESAKHEARPAPSRSVARYEPPAAPQADEATADMAAQPSETKEFPAPPPIPAQRRNAPSLAANEAPVAEAIAPPAPAMVAGAPPPPPPPPAPPAAEEKVAQGALADNVVVTGSRIRQTGRAAKSDELSRESGRAEAAADAQAAPDWVLNDRSYATFLSQLQAAVRANDRAAVVKLTGFPLRVNFKRPHMYPDAKSVLADYDRIFTPVVRKAILAQRFEQLFGRDQGVMIGSGEVWFDRVCLNSQCDRVGPVRIKSINPL